MLKNNLILQISLTLILFSVSSIYAQIGIDTFAPDKTALLELNSKSITSSSSNERGFLPPRVALLSNRDIATIVNPTPGLLIFNTSDAGEYPYEVSANNYYYWNGKNWDRLIYKSTVEEAVKPRMFYIEGIDTQSFTRNDINIPSGTPRDNVVKFMSPLLNIKDIIQFNSTQSTFMVNVSGIYELSAFVNYNPMANIVSGSHNKRAFLNLKIQVSKDGGINWINSIGTRTNWGVDAASTLKTAILLPTPLKLNKGDVVRLVIANPFNSTANNDHCGGGDCYIGNDLANNIPTSKGLKIQLLDYNIQ